MKLLKEHNEILRNALVDRDKTINDALDYAKTLDLDDDQLRTINKYLRLTQFLKDLLYLRTKHSVKELSIMYDVSTTHIYNTLAKIDRILK